MSPRPFARNHRPRRTAQYHSGRVADRRDRLTAVAALAATIAIVVIASVSAARAHDHTSLSPLQGSRATPSPCVTPKEAVPEHRRALAASPSVSPAPDPKRALAAALAPLLAHHAGDLAIGVIDRTTGERASYQGKRSFHTASIVKVDILAALLLRHQQAGTLPSNGEKELATEMIEESDNEAASDLWGDDGAAAGVAAANATLGLSHTSPGADDYWGLTKTTVADQLKLLEDLSCSRSPLDAASRRYELGLMEHVEPSQAWGVSAAAQTGAVAIKNGWLPDPDLWVANSIGVIHRADQELLVAVLSDDQPSEAAGIGQDEEAAVAAAVAITGR